MKSKNKRMSKLQLQILQELSENENYYLTPKTLKGKVRKLYKGSEQCFHVSYSRALKELKEKHLISSEHNNKLSINKMDIQEQNIIFPLRIVQAGMKCEDKLHKCLFCREPLQEKEPVVLLTRKLNSKKNDYVCLDCRANEWKNEIINAEKWKKENLMKIKSFKSQLDSINNIIRTSEYKGFQIMRELSKK